MATQISNSKAILEKIRQKKEEAEGESSTLATPKPILTSKEEEVKPLALVPSRTFNYWSKAPNTEIALNNKPPIKFKGSAYQTSDSHEISILDDMVKRIPNVFSKV